MDDLGLLECYDRLPCFKSPLHPNNTLLRKYFFAKSFFGSLARMLEAYTAARMMELFPFRILYRTAVS